MIAEPQGSERRLLDLLRFSLISGVLLLAMGFALMKWADSDQGMFCNLGAPLSLEPPPDGWEWGIDFWNDCAFTLFDSLGRRAPAEVYETTAYPAPPPYFGSQRFRWLAPIVMWVGSVIAVGAVAGAASNRHGLKGLLAGPESVPEVLPESVAH